MFFRYLFLLGVLFLITTSFSSVEADEPEYRLVIVNHRFVPETLEIPAGVKVKLIVENQDKSPEEFESYDLNREKIVAGKSKITVFVGPLEPGQYHFFGEFNPDTAKGTLVVKAKEKK